MLLLLLLHNLHVNNAAFLRRVGIRKERSRDDVPVWLPSVTVVATSSRST